MVFLLLHWIHDVISLFTNPMGDLTVLVMPTVAVIVTIANKWNYQMIYGYYEQPIAIRASITMLITNIITTVLLAIMVKLQQIAIW